MSPWRPPQAATAIAVFDAVHGFTQTVTICIPVPVMGWDTIAIPIGQSASSSGTGHHNSSKDDCDLHLYELER
jgi:hypothetical protein